MPAPIGLVAVALLLTSLVTTPACSGSEVATRPRADGASTVTDASPGPGPDAQPSTPAADARATRPDARVRTDAGFDPTRVPADPKFAKTKRVTSTIVISKAGTYDYKNVLHIWAGSGKCTQLENQPHILRIAASNVTVKNFAYRNAPDGIHIATCSKGQGNTCTGKISNIVLDNVTGWSCEDALTTGRGTSRITIKNSFFLGNPNTKERDKLLQLNFADDLRIENTVFKDGPRPVRFKGGAKITLVGNRFYNFQQAVRGDTNKDIANVPAGKAATVTAQRNHFQTGTVAYSADGKVTITATGDTFNGVRNKQETKNGARVTIR